MIQLHFIGVDRRGVARTGQRTIPDLHGPAISTFVSTRYDAGWKCLTVYQGQVEVGWIAHLDGKRVWSAEDYRP